MLVGSCRRTARTALLRKGLAGTRSAPPNQPAKQPSPGNFLFGTGWRPSVYAYTLTPMRAAELIKNATRSSGRSVRQLALEANLAGSTITRIQAGTMEPTLATAKRILGAAGYELQFELVRKDSIRLPRLGDLADAWSVGNDRLKIDWARWRGFLDHLALHPEQTPEAIYPTPPPTGNRVIDALTAAVAEKLADDANLQRPSWTTTMPVLAEPFQLPPIRSNVKHEIPHQLAARNLMIDTESLWRRRGVLGV